jgi:DUF3011 family protein
MPATRFVPLLLCLSTLSGISASAQGRLSDKDIENLMGNVKDDVKSFRPMFNSAIGKSSIRKTSREKDAKNLVAGLKKKTEAMRDTFRRTKKAEGNVRDVVATAQQIDDLVYGLRLNPQTTSQWEKVRGEIAQVSAAFGVREPFSHGIGAVGPAASNRISCTQTAGAAQAQKLVEDCLAVSPGTHPPCNAQNSCQLIVDEIRRGCNLIGQGAPGFCSEYLRNGAPYYGPNPRTVSCYSDDGNRRYCDADTRNGVELIRQRGSARCERGYSWDYDTRGVWVDHGCQAEFRLR